jgi:hypothetical protein
MRQPELMGYSVGIKKPPCRRSGTQPKLRLCSLIHGYGQKDSLRLDLRLNVVVYSEYGNPALDHLSTLSQFLLLSPSVLRSQPLLLSIPPLRKYLRSKWLRLSLPLRLSCGKRIRLGIRQSPNLRQHGDAAKCHLNEAICFLS